MTQDPDPLERRVDRALRRLPHPAAPPLFAERVMQRIETGARSLEWPVALKIALTGMSLVLVTGTFLMWPLALEFARTSWQSPAVVLLRTAGGAARPMVPIALVYVTAMCAVSAAAVSMLKHVALGGVTNS